MKRILLIDDNEEMLSVIEDALKKPSYQVDFCSDPFDVMKKIETAVYDLLICDIKMPGISGLKLIEELRRQGTNTPVLFITGESSSETAVEALRLRAVGVVEKPFRLKELREKVAKALG